MNKRFWVRVHCRVCSATHFHELTPNYKTTKCIRPKCDAPWKCHYFHSDADRRKPMQRKTVYCPIWKVISLLCSHCVWQGLLCLVLSFALQPLHHHFPAGPWFRGRGRGGTAQTSACSWACLAGPWVHPHNYMTIHYITSKTMWAWPHIGIRTWMLVDGILQNFLEGQWSNKTISTCMLDNAHTEWTRTCNATSPRDHPRPPPPPCLKTYRPLDEGIIFDSIPDPPLLPPTSNRPHQVTTNASATGAGRVCNGGQVPLGTWPHGPGHQGLQLWFPSGWWGTQAGRLGTDRRQEAQQCQDWQAERAAGWWHCGLQHQVSNRPPIIMEMMMIVIAIAIAVVVEQEY